MLIELWYWNKLPEQIPIHFNAQMVPDAWGSRLTGTMMLPLILTVAQLILSFFILRDPQNQELPVWIDYVVFSLMPILSFILAGIILSTAFNINLYKFKWILLSLVYGGMLVVIGLVLRKVTPNKTIGIRLPWTLHSAKNWQMTHRFGGNVFIIGGIVLAVCGLIWWQYLFLPVLLIVIILPCGYSYYLYRRGI